MKTKRVYLDISSELHRRAKVEAASRGVTLKALVEELLTERCELPQYDTSLTQDWVDSLDN